MAGSWVFCTRPAKTPGRRTADGHSGGDFGVLVDLPIPRKPLGDLAGGMIRQSGQDVGEPSLGIDVVHLAGLCRPSNYAEPGRFPQISG